LKTALQLVEDFRKRFGTPSTIYRAPGRVNLIGEHTDYNDGFVLPAAIGFCCWVAAARGDDRKLVIHSENFNETVEVRLDSLAPPGKKHWANYPLGVAWALEQAGKRLSGTNVLIAGEVPLGAGLSSSAAIEVAVGFALLNQGGHEVNRSELAKLCQRAENEFVGARVGIMDQFVSCHGRAGHALLLDCRSVEFELVKLPPEVQLVICNTMVKHEIGSGEYNTRRAECEEGVRKLRSVLPGIRELRDVTLAQLEEHRGVLEPKVYSRCRHVITENERVLKAVEAFKKGELQALVPLMRDSHRSLRDDYEVSSPELDMIVSIALETRGVLGARLTGAGFGGCAVALVEASEADQAAQEIPARYQRSTGRSGKGYICEASDGAHVLWADSRK
jgi:galactokinase